MGCYKNVSEKVPARHILCFMLFLGFMVTFLLRVNINLGIVAMVNVTDVKNAENDEFVSPKQNECQQNQQFSNASPPLNVSEEIELKKTDTIGEFDWNEFQQGIILSSFFWGYLLFQIPGGRVAELWGPKTVFGVSVLMNGLLALVLPIVARIHWSLLLVVRALQGLGQGVVFPCLNAAVARWVPVDERARFISFAIQGCSLGQVIALPLCGWILTSMGWPAVFYISGIFGVTWYVAWYFLVYDSPQEHPRISLKEKQYLQKHLKKIETVNAAPVPWMAILTSLQFWVGAIAGAGSDWGFHTLCTFGPKYIKNALGFDLEHSAWLSSLPFLSQYIFSMGYSTFCDWLLKVGVTIPVVRKISLVATHLLPPVGLLVLTFTGCHVVLSIVVLTISVTLLGALSSGFFQNPLDIAPNYAGSLTGITNTLGALTAVISTPMAGAILQANGSKSGWHYIFYITAIVYVASGLPYLFLAKMKIQPWNDYKLPSKENKILSDKNGDNTSDVEEGTALTPS